MVVFYHAVGKLRQVATVHAYGVHLGNIIRNGDQGGHRSKGLSEVVHVKSGNDDPDSAAGKRIAHSRQFIIEKLCLVDPNYIHIIGKQEDL